MLENTKVDILFDPELHKYTDPYGNEYTSVTTLIGKVQPKFDQEYWSIYKALQRSGYDVSPRIKSRMYVINNVPYTIQGIKKGLLPMKFTQAMMLDEWGRITREACVRGSRKHDYLENCINQFSPGESKRWDEIRNEPKDHLIKLTNKEELDNSPLKASDPKIYRILLWLIDRGFVIFAEKRVYSFYYLVAGMIDVFAYKPTTGEFAIVDWKTNKGELKWKSGYYKKAKERMPNGEIKTFETQEWVDKDERFLAPLQHLQICKGNIYSLQLSMYAYLCELLGYRPTRLVLVHLKHDGSIKIYKDVPYLRDEVYTLLEWNIASKRKYRKTIFIP